MFWTVPLANITGKISLLNHYNAEWLAKILGEWLAPWQAQNIFPEASHSLFLAGRMIFLTLHRQLNPWQYSRK